MNNDMSLDRSIMTIGELKGILGVYYKVPDLNGLDDSWDDLNNIHYILLKKMKL